ncbi:unnamed protein product, partial [Effrenium voratum]
EAEGPCCCQATVPANWCGGLFGMRVDHLFGLRIEGDVIPMCEAIRVLRDTPADEMASDHCAVLAQMDFVDDPDGFAPKDERTPFAPGAAAPKTAEICLETQQLLLKVNDFESRFTFGTSAPIQLPDFSQLRKTPAHEPGAEAPKAQGLRQAGHGEETQTALATVQEGQERPSSPEKPTPASPASPASPVSPVSPASPASPVPPRTPPPAIHRPLPPQSPVPPFVSPRGASPRTVSPRMAGNWHPHVPDSQQAVRTSGML